MYVDLDDIYDSSGIISYQKMAGESKASQCSGCIDEQDYNYYLILTQSSHG